MVKGTDEEETDEGESEGLEVSRQTLTVPINHEFERSTNNLEVLGYVIGSDNNELGYG